MAKLSINLQGRMNNGTDSRDHAGTRLARWEDDDKLIGKIPKAKKKQLLDVELDTQEQAASQYPHDYVEKLHVSKANWLGRRERGRER